MATCRSLIMVPVTLCFLFLVLPAQSKENLAGRENLAVVIFYGTARCKSNPSKIISNATLHVSINGTTLAAGKTTRSGRFLMAVRVTSKDLLSDLVSKHAVITTPRQACSIVPAPAAPARKLAAQAGRNGYRILADNNLGDLVDDEIMVDDGDILRFILMLGDPNISYDAIQRIVDMLNPIDFTDDEIESLMDYIDQRSEVVEHLNFIEVGVLDDPFAFVDTFSNFLGVPLIIN